MQWLIENKLLVPSPSKPLDAVYAQWPAEAKEPSAEDETLLTHPQIEQCTKALEIPELESELDRAVFQIEEELRKDEPQKQEKTGGAPPAQMESKEAKEKSSDEKKTQ